MLWRAVVALRPAKRRRRIARLLESEAFLVAEASGAGDLWQTLQREPSDLVFLSESLLRQSVEDALSNIRALPDSPLVVLFRDREDPEARAHLLGLGCAAVVDTELSDEALLETIRSVIRQRRESTVPGAPVPDEVERSRLGSFHSRNPAMHRVLEVARRVIAAESSVLILGETGVGKEHLARAIHEQGPRSGRPFVAVNCSAIAESLFESELFGHEHGAFTGAVRSHRGFFEVAHTGTIFLDEIAEAPLPAQVKLLRVLQDRVIQRVGSESTIPVDVRILAATNREVDRAIREGHLRPDLFYRIGVVTLTIPPLRERREDIPELVQTFLAHLRQRIPTEVESVDDSCMRALMAYEWPGNVRELLNVLERALLITDARVLRVQDLPESLRIGYGRTEASPPPPSGDAGAFDPSWLELPLREARQHVVAAFEKSYLEEQLRRCHGRIGVTAARAGITPRALYEQMRRHGLQKEDFRP